jgi:transposase
VSNPQILVRSTVSQQASLLPRVRLLVAALSTAEVSGRKALLAKWTKDPSFLLQAYLYWIPPALHTALKSHISLVGWLKSSPKLDAALKEWKNETNDF